MKNLLDHHFAKLCLAALITGGGLFFVIEPWLGFGKSSPENLTHTSVNEDPKPEVVTVHTTKRIPLNTSTTEDESPDSEQNVSIEITGLKPESANVCFAIFESAEGFPNGKTASQTFAFPVESEAATFELMLPTAKPIAIAVFQDLDGNGQLSKSGFGIPNEPYGFSNNARGSFGPPTFTAARVMVSPENNTLSIELK